MPCLMEQATRAFFYKGASFADRIALIKQHIIHLETHLTDDFLLKIYEAHDKITLGPIPLRKSPLRWTCCSIRVSARKAACLWSSIGDLLTFTR